MENPYSQLRRDPHHGGWILLNPQPEREQLLTMPRERWPIPGTPDALCDPEGSGAKILWSSTQSLPDGTRAGVKVIANRFPLYGVEGQEEKLGVGMYDQMRGIGAHEIIIESEKHQDTLLTIHPQHYALTLRAIQDRIRDLRNDFRLRSFHVYREWVLGPNAPKLHPHSQLIASAILPLGCLNELESARAYYNYKERCLFCDMIRQEKNDVQRLVYNNGEYVAFCPFASRYPFEVHLFPHRHNYDFIQEPPDNLTGLAEGIRDVAARLEQAIPGWNLLMVLHTAPTFHTRMNITRTILADYHWHIEFLPHPPGFIDWFTRTGTCVEHTPPEKAAEYLRGVEVASPWE